MLKIILRVFIVFIFSLVFIACDKGSDTESSYQVIFKDYDGTELKTETVKHGSSATAPDIPSREGYTFYRWDSLFNYVKKDLVVTATYRINKYKVIFEDFDGETIEEVEVEHGASVTPPIDPTRDGYEFSGWDKLLDNITSDLVIKAKYNEIQYLLYEINGDEVTLTGYNGQLPSVLNLPEYIENKKVTRIADFAFSKAQNLVSVKLPKSLIYIGEGAFQEASNLLEFEIPNSVIYIEKDVLQGASSLQRIKTPFIGQSRTANEENGLFGYLFGKSFYPESYYTTFGYYVPDSLNTVIITDTVNINNNAFRSVNSITHLELPENLLMIGDYAFYFLNKLENLTIPKSVTEIGDYAFSELEKLKSLNFAEDSNLETLGKYAFSEASSLTNINIPNGITQIEEYTFSGLTSLTNVVIPNSVTRIENHAFSKASSLTNIVIPNSVTSIKDHAFSQLFSLTSITLPFVGESRAPAVNNSHLGYIFGNTDFRGGYDVNGYIIPFNLKEVIITDTTLIGEAVFSNAYSLTNIVIQDGVTEIGKSAFSGLTNLKAFVIPDTVTKIGELAFSNTSSLTDIVIPDSVTEIGKATFFGASSIARIRLPFVGASRAATGNKAYFGYIFGDTSYQGGYLANGYIIPESLKEVIITDIKLIGEKAFSGASSLTSLILPNDVTNIGAYAFEGASGLENIEIPKNIKVIGDFAYFGLWNLTSIIIPEGVMSIGESAFSGARSVTSIVIPDTVTHIGAFAFSGVRSLKSVEIPNSVYYIGSSAFSGTSQLQKITLPFIGYSRNAINSDAQFGFIFGVDSYTGAYKADDFNLPISLNEIIITDANNIGARGFYDARYLTKIEIASSVTSIGTHAFCKASNLTAVIFEENSHLTTIGDFAFSNAVSLTSIYIPKGVLEIGSYAFHNATSLGTVVFETGSQLTTIREHAFYSATSLKRIVIPNNVRGIGSFAFSNDSNLISIIIPDTVINIGVSVFVNANNLSIYSESSAEPAGWDPLWNYSDRPVYWASEWHYDTNGNPQPN